jgi:hypothetical protein
MFGLGEYNYTSLSLSLKYDLYLSHHARFSSQISDDGSVLLYKETSPGPCISDVAAASSGKQVENHMDITLHPVFHEAALYISNTDRYER